MQEIRFSCVPTKKTIALPTWICQSPCGLRCLRYYVREDLLYYLWWTRSSVPPSARLSVCAKNLDHLFTGISALSYESSEDSSNQPYGSMGSPGCPLDPLDPLNPPPQTHKQVSWPYCTLKITSTASQITFTFIPVTPVTPSPSSPPSPPLSLT